MTKLWAIISLLCISFMQSNKICNHDHISSVSTFTYRLDHNYINELISTNVEDSNFASDFKNINEIDNKSSDTITWKTLNQLEYKETETEMYGTVFMPEFSSELKKIDGKTVIIKGYIIPVDRKTYALSKNVYAACFFCGKSGPETVMGLIFKEAPGKLKMDSYATLRGTLKLNDTNVEEWMYSLENVEILSIQSR